MTTPKTSFTAWSYSRWHDWYLCPRKAKYKFLDGRKEPPNQAMERGSQIHKDAEQYIVGNKTTNPFEEFGTFKRELDKLKKRPDVVAEAQWTFTEDWAQTGWRDDDAWLRMGIDAHFPLPKAKELVIVDFKTGKVREENLTQLGLYALGAFMREPSIAKVHLEFWYLDAGTDQYVFYDREELEELKAAWEKRAADMFADRIFPTRPGPRCRFCFYRKSNGGPCEF